MSIFVEVAGEKLFSGATTSEVAAYSTAELATMTVAEIQAFRNTHIVLEPSPEIQLQIEERAVASFEVWDEEDHHNFEYGQEVLISDTTGRLFGGVIEGVDKQPITPSTDHGYLYNISCVDYQALADRRQIYKAYESATTEEIVYYILSILAEEGITLGAVQAGPTLTQITFNGISCAEALDKAAEWSGCTWWIDEYKRLYFVARTTYSAEWDIVDGSEIQWDPTPKLSLGNPEYRNVQYLQSGAAETSAITQRFKGDGTNQTFTVGFPIARAPTITLNGNAQTVGIKGVNSSGYDWYWNEGEATVTQESGDTPISSTDVLSITFIGTFELICKATRTAEVTRQRLAQGFGTGKIEKTYRDTTIKSQTAGLDAAKAKLTHYATVGRKLEYDTLDTGLAVGTIQTVTLPVLGLADADMLIYAMVISWPDAVTTYTVSVCEGPVEESWEKLFCGITEELRKSASEQAGEADVVQGLEEFSKTWLSSAHPNPFISVYPGTATPADVDFPCLAEGDRLSYLVLYDDGDHEFFRKPVTLQTESDDRDEIYTTVLVLAAEANDEPISAVALWGGDGCSATPGSGIMMEKHSYSKQKNSLESLQFDFVDIKGW